MSDQKRSPIQVDEVLAFKGVTPTIEGNHVLVKLDASEGERVLGIRTSDAVHIAINMLACAIQANDLKGASPESGVLLQANDCEVVMSGDRLLLRIVGENGVSFVFDFDSDKAPGIVARLGDLAHLLSAERPMGTRSQ